jgi:hypothetical protein
MDRKLSIILCSSNHLPSGTGEEEFEELYNKDIKPLISSLDKFPRITMAFHYSGVLLHWIERRHPELFMLLEDLLSRRQVEFLGGGFYNPVLPLLPLSDKIGQIEMLTTYLRKQFGKRPQGCWLPAMIWEQNMVGPLTSCGMSYTFLDEEQFSRAGADPGEGGVFLPCLTEDQGKLLTVFPVASEAGRELRNGTPGNIPEELLEKLPRWEENQALTLPVGGGGVQAVEYEALFAKLSDADPRVEFSTPARVIKNLRRLKKIYFPGGCVGQNAGNRINPRQFLADYPEAGGIYSKMVHVHTLINNQLRGDKTRKRTALEELWKAQDSGVFRLGDASSPGLIRSPVRKAAYRSLLESEKIIREKIDFSPSLSVFDFDLDGEGEYIFRDEKINCLIKSRGAGIFELDYLPGTWNYLDTMGPERGNPSGGPGGGGRRCAFADWFAPEGTLPEDAGPGGIKGGRFCGGEEYAAAETDRVGRRVSFAFSPGGDSPWGEVEMVKTWQLKRNSLDAEYVLKNPGRGGLRFVFAPSIDLSFPGEGEGFLRVMALRENGKEALGFGEALTIGNIRALEFRDIKNEAVITLQSDRGYDGRLFQIRAGFPGREEYQSTCLMPLLPVSLDAGGVWKAGFSLKISP